VTALGCEERIAVVYGVPWGEESYKVRRATWNTNPNPNSNPIISISTPWLGSPNPTVSLPPPQCDPHPTALPTPKLSPPHTQPGSATNDSGCQLRSGV